MSFQDLEIKITDAFMNEVLENDAFPESIYKFCKAIDVKEEDFYEHFGTLDVVKARIWSRFFMNALEVLSNSEEYEKFPSREKIITFYFTLFEVFKANRSYILKTLECEKPDIKNLSQLKEFREHFKDYFKPFLEERDSKVPQLKTFKDKALGESAWAQFLFLLNFWIHDTSKGFEKTDILIEKSMKTVFDLLDRELWDSVFDLGKFLWKEKSMSV
jgi:hypothetical protein